jgi:hypothetical protein
MSWYPRRQTIDGALNTLINVASAAKWTTARNLAGNSVDGSANVAFVNKFVVQGTTDSGLTGAQFLGSLATGLVKNTTSTGVLSTATPGTDYSDPAVDTLQADALVTGESTIPRRVINSGGCPSGNGNCRFTYFTAKKTETITQVRVPSGSTAAVGATLCRVGIYSVDGSGNLTLIASTPNDTTLWIATNTGYTKSLSASFSKVRGTRYAVGIIVVGSSTAPQFNGIGASADVGIAPRIAGVVGSLSDLPSSQTAGSIGDTVVQAYSVLLP